MYFSTAIPYGESRTCGGVRSPRPTVITVVRGFKSMVTRELGKTIWQTSFYEHVIRNEEDYKNTRQYIDNNPHKWMLDEYYTP